MKLPAVKSFACSLLVGLVAACVGFGAGVGTLSAQTSVAGANGMVTTPAASPSDSPADAQANKKPKKNYRPDEPTPTPRVKTQNEIRIPLPTNEPAYGLKIPETDLTGKLLSLITAAKATKIDDEHVRMERMKMDLNHPDGKEDFHVLLPTSIFNLKTRIITSNEAVTVQTQDFELTGEGMEFNTVDRTGQLLGKVRMIIHNLKRLAGQDESTPKSE